MKERVAALVGNRGPADVGEHVPLGVRADPARRARARRPEVDVLDLRRRRLAPADAAGRRASSTSTRSGTRPARSPPRCPTSRTSWSTRLAATAAAKGPDQRIVAEAYELYQRRLQEAHALDFDDLIMTTVHLFQSHPEVARAVPPAVPARAGRRVPGHQPRPVRAGQGTGRRSGSAGRAPRASCAWSATPTSRSTRSGARRSATSSSSSGTTPTPARSCWSRTTAPPRRS